MTTLSKTNKENSTKLSKRSETLSSNIPRSLPFEARRVLKRVQSFAAKHTLWQRNARILIAVSGGPDSVCLLDLLVFLQKKYAFTLAIAHVNYQLRQEASDLDEAFVRRLARAYGVPCYIKRYSKRCKKHDEETLRTFRTTFFETLRKKHHFQTIALGHHANDQAETLLMNLLRGSGPMGLAGMLPHHQAKIRPLLALKREDILRYLHARSLPFRTDESNSDAHYTRNRIRHELLPLLENRFNPNIVATLARSATHFQNMPHKNQSSPKKGSRKH